ncbi:MAG: Uroporphyrinogen decarboxylase [Chlamydiae bacterium]|nr:Uroporphyrinogen decarboxylase [Chlamydiota bacterium]
MSKILDALHQKNFAPPPIWMMRQAGRYLPEYRKLKGSRSLYEMFHDPNTIIEVTLQPIKRLHTDAAILFSDILTVLDGLGVSYEFQEGIGPVVAPFSPPLSLRPPHETYAPITHAIKELRNALPVPLLGFAGAPFTVACYLIEGKTSHDQKKTKQMLMRDPQGFSKLLDVITEATIAYLQEQVNAGVQAIQLFDSWANVLSLEDFRKCSLQPMEKILQAVDVPVILFCRGSCFFAEELASIKPAGISLDWSGEIAEIRKRVGPGITLQGNLDPMVLYGSKQEIAKRVDPILESMEGDPAFIFNLGHGLLPDIPVENVEFLVDYVHNHARARTEVS